MSRSWNLEGAEMIVETIAGRNELANAASRIASEAYDEACEVTGCLTQAREIALDEISFAYRMCPNKEMQRYLLAFMCIISGATVRGSC